MSNLIITRVLVFRDGTFEIALRNSNFRGAPIHVLIDTTIPKFDPEPTILAPPVAPRVGNDPVISSILCTPAHHSYSVTSYEVTRNMSIYPALVVVEVVIDAELSIKRSISLHVQLNIHQPPESPHCVGFTLVSFIESVLISSAVGRAYSSRTGVV